MTKLEEIGRALAARTPHVAMFKGTVDDLVPSDAGPVPLWQKHATTVRFVIEQLREPSEAMKDAGWSALLRFEPGWSDGMATADAVWGAMIDVLLRGKLMARQPNVPCDTTALEWVAWAIRRAPWLFCRVNKAAPDGLAFEICRHGLPGEDEIVLLGRARTSDFADDYRLQIAAQFQAHAAIAALRNPTEEVMNAFRSASVDEWNAAIDTLLREANPMDWKMDP